MGNVYTYNPRKVTCALGNHVASGFADDSFISLEPLGDGTSAVTGADGETVRSVDPNTLWTLKLTLLQNSPTNQYLNKQYKKDRNNGDGMFSVNVSDLLGKEKFVGSSAWVNKPAAWVRGKQQNNREWEITVSGDFA